jgi:hypothetical protein
MAESNQQGHNLITTASSTETQPSITQQWRLRTLRCSGFCMDSTTVSWRSSGPARQTAHNAAARSVPEDNDVETLRQIKSHHDSPSTTPVAAVLNFNRQCRVAKHGRLRAHTMLYNMQTPHDTNESKHSERCMLLTLARRHDCKQCAKVSYATRTQ